MNLWSISYIRSATFVLQVFSPHSLYSVIPGTTARTILLSTLVRRFVTLWIDAMDAVTCYFFFLYLLLLWNYFLIHALMLLLIVLVQLCTTYKYYKLLSITARCFLPCLCTLRLTVYVKDSFRELPRKPAQYICIKRVFFILVIFFLCIFYFIHFIFTYLILRFILFTCMLCKPSEETTKSYRNGYENIYEKGKKQTWKNIWNPQR